MACGAPGVPGVHAQDHVAEGTETDVEPVTVLLQQMEEISVLVILTTALPASIRSVLELSTADGRPGEATVHAPKPVELVSSRGFGLALILHPKMVGEAVLDHLRYQPLAKLPLVLGNEMEAGQHGAHGEPAQ